VFEVKLKVVWCCSGSDVTNVVSCIYSKIMQVTQIYCRPHVQHKTSMQPCSKQAFLISSSTVGDRFALIQRNGSM